MRVMSRKWTSKEHAYLCANYLTLGPDVCAHALRRTVKSVMTRAYAFGIVRKHRGKPLESPLWEPKTLPERLQRMKAFNQASLRRFKGQANAGA